MEALTTVTVLLRRWIFPALVGALTLGCSTAPSFESLTPISANGRELRVLVHHYPLAAQSAYVVTPGTIVQYEFDGTRWRSRERETSTADAVLIAIAQLVGMDGKDLSCGLADGNVYHIEGVIDGQRFAFTASNPDFCLDAESQQVTAVIGLFAPMLKPAPSP